MLEGEVRESFRDRLLHKVESLFSTRYRAATPREANLLRQLAEEKAERAVAEARLEQAKMDLAMANSNLMIAQNEIAKLNLVCERDRMRVQADLASLARRVAEETE